MAQLQDLVVDTVSLVDRAAVRDPQKKSEPRRWLLAKREGASTDDEGEAGMASATEEPTAAETGQSDELSKAQEALRDEQARVAELEKAAAAKSEGGEGSDSDEDDETKQRKDELSPEAREAIAKAERETADLRSRLEKAEGDVAKASELAKAERDVRVEREYVAKAEDWRALAQEPTKLGPVLKRAAEQLSAEDYGVIEGLLVESNAALTKSAVFEEYGSDGRPTRGGITALEKAEDKAAELRKADSSLGEAEALQQAMESDPELAAEYAREA